MSVADGNQTVIEPPETDGPNGPVRWYPFTVTWSPDGTTLLYTAWSDGPGSTEQEGVLAVPADTPSDVTVLTDTATLPRKSPVGPHPELGPATGVMLLHLLDLPERSPQPSCDPIVEPEARLRAGVENAALTIESNEFHAVGRVRAKENGMKQRAKLMNRTDRLLSLGAALALALTACGGDDDDARDVAPDVPSVTSAPDATHPPATRPSSTPARLVLTKPMWGTPMTVRIAAAGWHGLPQSGLLERVGGGDGSEGAALIGPFYGELYVYGDPCQWSSTMPDTPATTVDEVVAALTAQASRRRLGRGGHHRGRVRREVDDPARAQ